MMRSTVLLVTLLSVVLAAAGLGRAQERVDRTGTRLGTDTTQRMVYRFSPSRDVQRVLALLEQGRTDEAVEFASDYLDRLRATIPANGASASTERYFARNALCVALTKAGRLEEAIATCSDAIEMFPTRWMALNSRATAYYVSRQFDSAIADYRRALEVAPDDERVVETLEHNIALAEQRLAEADARP